MIKIQLDHTAIEKVITDAGEDFALEIRAGVLQTAIKKCVSQIVPSEVTKIIVAETKKEVEKSVGKVISNWGSMSKITISKEFKEKLTDTINNEIRSVTCAFIDPDTIRKRIEAYVDAYEKEFETRLADHFRKIYSKKVDDALDKYIDSLVEAKVQQRLATLEG